LIKSSWAYAKSLLDADDTERGYTLEGHDLDCQVWLRHHFPHVTTAPLAERHIRLWDWFENLERGIKPPPQIEIWARGSAKSTTAELGVVRVGVKLSRRFVLYVSGIQDQADSHVQSIATYLETVGAEPMLNKMGRAKGWRRNQLRTANGFNVAAFGIDNCQRGIKIDEFRPDLIIVDDVDSRHDSIDAVNKKIEALVQTILPTGSTDCAILFVENMVHSNSIAKQFEDGRAKFLLNRIVPTPVPAVEGLQVDTVPASEANKVATYKVIAGTATWAGQSLATCEQQINEWGLDAFMREAQHDVRHAGDLFFPTFEGYDFYGSDLDGRHICNPFDIPSHWGHFAGYDDGRYNPAALTLFAISERGFRKEDITTVFGVGELVRRGLSPDERADAVAEFLLGRGLLLDDVVIHGDPSMWAKQVGSDGIGRAPVEAFWARGLRVVKANNNRAHGLDNLTEYVKGEYALQIFKGACPELVRQFSTAVHDKNRVEDLDDDADIAPSHMDALSSARYGLHSRPRASVAPVDNTKTQQELIETAIRERLRKHTNQQRRPLRL